ncbi:hypothetical protein M378DRAFT_89177, partial [Amanita muscaria Koide BX008]
MSNEDGLKEDGITNEQLEEKIPQQLRYACVYWVNHLKIANVEDADLMNGLKKFVDEHILHWLEVLSLIGKLDSAHRAIRVALILLKSTSSDLHQLLSDTLRFIPKFYEVIDRSALHTYYSALHFTPTDSLLYRRYIKEAAHSVCDIEGGPEKWNALVANQSHEEYVSVIKFSLDSTLFVSCSRHGGSVYLWDIRGIDACSPSEREEATGVTELVLSRDCSRLACGFSDGTVELWETSPTKRRIASHHAHKEPVCALEFGPDAGLFASGSDDGTIKLWNGGDGSLRGTLSAPSG